MKKRGRDGRASRGVSYKEFANFFIGDRERERVRMTNWEDDTSVSSLVFLPPFQSVYNLLGETLSRLQQYAEAERWFQASLASQPDHVPAHITYGKLLARNVSSRRSLRSPPSLPPSLFHLIAIYFPSRTAYRALLLEKYTYTAGRAPIRSLLHLPRPVIPDFVAVFLSPMRRRTLTRFREFQIFRDTGVTMGGWRSFVA